MQLEPKELLMRLEYDKIIALATKECLTPMAADEVAQLSPGTDLLAIEKSLGEIQDFKTSLEKNDRFPIGGFEDIHPYLTFLEKDGYSLQAEAFLSMLRILVQTRDIFRFFSGVKKEIYPHLHAIMRHLNFEESLIKAILRVFTEQGEIRPDASPELERIRRMIISKQRELDTRFRQIIQEYRTKGFLSDSPESFRNNRRVLSVPSEHKRKIRGIIHDESDTGRTAYIEPEGVIEINNDIFDFEQEEKREIYRILRDLTAQVRPYSNHLTDYQAMLLRYDVVQAKAKLAFSMHANMPEVKPEPVIALRKAFHPLLFLKNKGLGRKTVPMELKLGGEQRILMLSGPNAGGKSISMKTVGLLQLMVQSGLLVPVHPTSRFGIFKKIFADIGDQQSLEDDLSTYSSKLQNARIFTENADPETLVLMDEMGSGTDPKPGGAIAEAILRDLNNRGVFGVLTTHYGNLKAFAFRNHGILNGNMHFDKDTMAPTYELKVGRPGSSYAFEIAEKSGLNRRIIEYARMKTGKGETAVDDLLIDLQREKQELEEQIKTLKTKEQSVDRLMNTYQALQNELDMRRQRFKLEERELELRKKTDQSRELQKLVKELKEEKNLEKVQTMVKELRHQQVQETQKVDEVYAEVIRLEQKTEIKQRVIAKGDTVRMRTGRVQGEVLEIKGNNATVMMGQVRMEVPLKQLVLAQENQEKTVQRSKNDINRAVQVESKLDIRGMSMEEAMAVIERFMDDALLGSSTLLSITHGKGTGVLRKVVRTKLREYGHNVAKSYHPLPELGGDGVTIIELA